MENLENMSEIELIELQDKIANLIFEKNKQNKIRSLQLEIDRLKGLKPNEEEVEFDYTHR